MTDYNSPVFMAKVLDAYNIDFTQNKVVCPFHGDVNPSMSIDLAKSRVYCFGCQKSYSATQFIEAAEPKMNRLQVYKRMAEIENGIKIDLKPQHIRNNSDCDFVQLRIQAEDYYYNLPKTDWAHGEWTEELDYMTKRGFTTEILNKCGAKLNYNGWYPIIFPIMDNGKFKGWVCRTTRKDIEAKRKYLYNTGFRRSTCVCGRYNRDNQLIVVEGYMDMLKLRQAGLTNVVALLGWKASQEQVQMIKTVGIKHIISALDNDESGIKGDAHLRTLGFDSVVRWQFGAGHKDPGDQTASEIKNIYKKLKISVDKANRM